MRQAPQSEILARAAAIRAQKKAQEPTPAPAVVTPKARPAPVSVDVPDWLTDTLDEVPRDAVETVDSDAFMRSVIDGLDILTAYDKYCGKKRDEQPRGDEIMASCPTPNHRDNNPSACLNIAKNQWVCYGCREGGDVLGLVGGFLNLDPHVPSEYMTLTKTICRDLGYTFWTDTRGHERIVLPEAKPIAEVVSPEQPELPAAEILRDQEPVVMHGTIDDVPEIFDLEEAHDKGELTKPEPPKLDEDTAWLANTLDEMNDIGGRDADGKSRHTSMMDKLKAKLGKAAAESAPPVADPVETKVAEVAAKVAPELIEPEPVVESVAQKPPRKNPFLAGIDKIFGSATDAKANAETPEPDREIVVDETPIFTDTPSIDWRNIFPENTFIHDYVSHAVIDDDCVEEFHVWNAISAVGLALAKDVGLNDSPIVYGNFYVCNVARSGGRKSKTNGLLMDILQKSFPYDAQSGNGLMVPIPAPSSGESLIDVFVNDQPDPLNQGQTITHRVRGLMEVPELSGLVNVATRNGNVLESVLINLFDCRNEITTTSRGSGIQKAKEPFGSMLTAVQPKLLQSLVSDKMVNSGFANRFVWVFGPEKTELPMGSIDSHTASVNHLVIKLKNMRDEMLSSVPLHRGTNSRLLKMDPESARIYSKFHYETMVPAKAADESDLSVRANLLMKKLILVFTANMGKSSVPPEAVEQAIKLWPYLMACYARVGSQINSTIMRDAEARVLTGVVSFTKKHGKGPTRRELWNSSIKGYKLIESRDALGKLMATMVKDGILEELPPKPGTRGMPQPRYVSTSD